MSARSGAAQRGMTRPKKRRIDSRAKGSRFELRIAKRLTAWWGREFRRTPLSGGWSTNAPGDLVTPEDFPCGIEAKHQEAWNFDQWIAGRDATLRQWWDQAHRACRPGQSPMLVVTRNHQPVYVLLGAPGRIFTDAYGMRAPQRVAMIQARFCVYRLDDLLALDPEPLRVRGGG